MGVLFLEEKWGWNIGFVKEFLGNCLLTFDCRGLEGFGSIDGSSVK